MFSAVESSNDRSLSDQNEKDDQCDDCKREQCELAEVVVDEESTQHDHVWNRCINLISGNLTKFFLKRHNIFFA